MDSPEHSPAGPGDPPRPRHGVLAMLGRILIAGLAIVISVNLWSGFPILSLWVGSRFAGGDVLSMRGIVVALLTLTAITALGVSALTRLSARYDELTGRPAGPREPTPWMRSLGSERVSETRRRTRVNTVERIMITTVVVAAVAFEVWFFFLAKLALPS
jgi:hypothetical protein